MSALPTGPALPWAHVSPGPAQAPAQNAAQTPAPASNREDTDLTAEACSLEELGLDIGARVEVKWEIEDDQKTTIKWWGATVDSVPSSEPVAEDQRKKARVYLLRYDAYEDFEAEEKEVVFISNKKLADVEAENVLRWRKEGEAPAEGQNADEEDSEDEVMEDEEATGFTLEQFVQHAEAEASPGDGVLNVPVPNITPFQERLAAAHLGDLIRGFMSHMNENKEAGGVITAEDVAAYFKDKIPK